MEFHFESKWPLILISRHGWPRKFISHGSRQGAIIDAWSMSVRTGTNISLFPFSSLASPPLDLRGASLFFSRDILTMQQGTPAISASISARYQSVTNSYRCNEYETQPPPRLATLQPFLSPLWRITLYIYISLEGGEVESNRAHPLRSEYLIPSAGLRLT